MTWHQFSRLMGKIEVQRASTDDVAEFLEVVDSMINLLDEADQEDFFGTEGWKHRLGLED